MNMTNFAEVAHSAKTGVVAAVATISSGVGTFLGYLPDMLGAVASCVGIVYLVVQIIYLIRKGRDERAKAKIEQEYLLKKLEKVDDNRVI